MLGYGDFYIDLGTTNTLIYTRTHDCLINEATLLTLNRVSGKKAERMAFGNLSKISIGKSPDQMQIVKPLKEGVISDFKATLKLVRLLMEKFDKAVQFKRPRVLISLPQHVSQHERQVITELGKGLGAHTVHLISEPMAAAIGEGLEVLESRGKMVIDIGGGITEAAIISLGGIVNSNSVRVGGESIDESLVAHIKNHYLFSIGSITAEKLKIEIGSLLKESNNAEGVDIKGVNLKTALPGKLKVTPAMIYTPLDNFAKEVLKVVKLTLEKCPPELAGDLLEDGILMVGGGSLLKGLKERVEQETGVKTKISPNPLLSVANGGMALLSNDKLFQRLQENL